MKEEKRKPTLFLIDGNNYVYRAFYAIKGLTNSKGFPTNAIYGFTNMLMKLCREWEPDYIAVVFDPRGPTLRHEIYGEYKAARKAMPDDLVLQIPCIKEIVRGFSMPVIEEAGIEADDVIATIAKMGVAEGMKTFVVSGDKDLMQIVSDDVVMVDTMKDKMYTVEGVKERFGVEPDKVAYILGLAGDASDNIPGVPGIGEKTALKLVKEWGNIENILENVDKIKNAKVKRNLREFAAQALLSLDLATVRENVNVTLNFDHFRYSEPNSELLRDLFKEFDFVSLLQSLKLKNEEKNREYSLIFEDEELNSLIERLQSVDKFSFDLALSADQPMRAGIIGLSISPAPKEAYYIPFCHAYEGVPQQIKIDYVFSKLRSFLSDESIKKFGHDIKSSLIALSRNGIDLKGIHCDTMIASYVINPSKPSFNLVNILLDHLNYESMNLKDLVGTGKKAIPFSSVRLEKAEEYMCERTDFIYRLSEQLCESLAKEGFENLFYEVEMPLLEVLTLMEKKGVLLDANLLEKMSGQLGDLMALSEQKIYNLAGEKFNINSPKQLQVILFDKQGLPKGRKTKNGYSTDVEVLAKLAISYELPAEIMVYRSLAKLKSTYVDALPMLINSETGRVHTSYNQTATATGRLSSSNPNLQNIPIRTPEGRRIRQAFIASEGHIIVSSDYSQIELRIMAHFAGDETLIRAFESGEDIHRRTASDIFGVFPEMVDENMRRQAKVINFGILYGMSPFGLAKELDISQRLARDYIEGYFHKFHKVREFIDGVLEKARKNGFVTTLLNRRRYLPDINSKNPSVRQFAERTAVNTPIQGTAADLIKLAMLNIWKVIKKKKMSTSMIMQVHDELVFEVPMNEKDDAMDIIRREMEEVIEMRVPLKVEINSGKHWDEAH